jgi:hypothetical protein
MNSGFPPLGLPQPIRADRRKEKPRRAPLPVELLSRRGEIARVLGVQVTQLSQTLRQLSDDERRAIFYKLEHDAPVSLDGTGLKPISQPTSHVTLAVPREDNLDRFVDKIKEFGTGTVKNGHAPHESLAYLTNVQPGDPKDRLSEELFSQYAALVRQVSVICEIEILSLKVGAKQQREEIHAILAELQAAFAAGAHGTLFEHEEIRGTCRAVIRCTGKMFQKLVEDRKWWTRISWFEPRPRFETFRSVLESFSVQNLGSFIPPNTNASIVCIVDTGVTSGNPFLKPVTKDELLRSFLKAKASNPFDEFGHGSGVASLASYYALNLDNGGVNRGKVWIAGARILNEQDELEDERLFSKLLREVVDTFVPLGVRIFNLSIGDIAKQWNPATRRTVPRNSWVARTIDRLSREKDVVFVTCTGNLTIQEIKEYRKDDTTPYPAYLLHENARILDPGQAALALTVGSVAPGTLVVGAHATAIAEKYQASPFTRSGPGIRKEIKPELVEFGGNLVLDKQGDWVRENPGTNVIMASHRLTPAIAHNPGSSYAAARTAHKLAVTLDDLHQLGLQYVSSALMKAFLVNSASYPDEEEVQTFKDNLNALHTKAWLNVLGYGIPSDVRATYCDDFSAILFYQGEIQPDQVAYFEVPVPACLQESDGSKRLTVTVVHTPEVQRWGLERYLGTDLKWRVFRGDVDREEIVAAMSIEEEDGEAPTDDEESDKTLPNEAKFELGISRRSRGVVQHDVCGWTRHKREYSDNHYTLAVAAYERWHRTNPSAVPYAVVIRLEDTGRRARVYSDIQTILAQIEAVARARA